MPNREHVINAGVVGGMSTTLSSRLAADLFTVDLVLFPDHASVAP
jgi:hypothetical protein